MRTHLSIDQRQRDAESGRLLRAYAAEYRRAKFYKGLRLTVSGTLAIAGPILGALSIPPAGLVGAAAGLWVFISRLLLIPAERSRVGCAVRIQERFDTRLFDIPWAEALAGPEPSEEDIVDAARRLHGDKRLAQQHAEGWYPSTEGLPWPVDVLVAQWSSAVYGRRQHDAYFWFVAIGMSAVVAIAIVFGVALEMSLSDWLVTFLLPGLPALLDFGELAASHRRVAAAKEAIEAQITVLWRTEFAKPGTLTAEDCRRVQDEAFKLRAQDVQVPEWFYRVHRDRNEDNMHDAASARRTQYQDRWN